MDVPAQLATISESLPFTVSETICRDFERASRFEWLETNHTGAYAMGTVAGVNTRRYHALLIASLHPPADRYSILPRVEEQLTMADRHFELGTVQYPGAIEPRGFELLEEFRLDPFPVWRYRCAGALVEKTICLLDRQQSVLVRYEVTQPCRLGVRLFLAFRDYHSLTHRNSALSNRSPQTPGRISFHPYPDLPALTVFHNGAFHADGLWYENHEYLRELERGLDFHEDLFSPGVIYFEAGAQQRVWFLATLEPERFPGGLRETNIESILTSEAARRRFPSATQLQSTLIRALDQFRVARSDGQPSLIAGYPWFTDWSRDTLISLPALSVAGFPHTEIKQILTTLIDQRSQGLLPNRFSDRNSQPEYNTADASLWLLVAAHHLIEQTNDLPFLRDPLYPAALDIVNWHQRGTLYNIHVDPTDHLLCAGTPRTQLTWMDAAVNGSPVTPRNGKPVEINALWYNALRIVAKWAHALGDTERHVAFEGEAALALSAFQNAFWNPQCQCLYDVITPTSPDPTIRPNQLFALSLPFPLPDRERARAVVDLVREKLFTPVGVRTLDPGDPAYRPRFEGNLSQRDSEYHQGTVWPWLIGPFIAAYLNAYGESQEAVAFCRQITHSLERELSACCLGSLSEVYDAESPQLPNGCPAQLWSVAQLIIALKRLGSLESRLGAHSVQAL